MIDFTKVDDWVYYTFKYVAISALLVLVFFVIKAYIVENNDKEEIIANKAFTKGKIIDYRHSGISDHAVDYVYEVEGITYKEGHGIELLPCAQVINYSNCIGEEYWVIYSKINPEKSHLLATAHTYEWFGLKVPEELK